MIDGDPDQGRGHGTKTERTGKESVEIAPDPEIGDVATAAEAEIAVIEREIGKTAATHANDLRDDHVRNATMIKRHHRNLPKKGQ